MTSFILDSFHDASGSDGRHHWDFNGGYMNVIFRTRETVGSLMVDAASPHGTCNGWRSCAWYSFLLPRSYRVGKCIRCEARRKLNEIGVSWS